MDSQPGYSYSVDPDLSKILAEAGRTTEDVENAFVAEPSLEELATETARLGGEAARALPETPWYPAILMAILTGAGVALLYLMA